MITKILRWLLFIPLTIIAFYIIELAFNWLLDKAIGLSLFWLIVIVFVFSSLIAGLFASLCSIAISPLIKVAPNKKVAGIIFAVIAIIVCIADIVAYVQYDISIMAKIIIVIQILVVWGALAVLGFKGFEAE